MGTRGLFGFYYKGKYYLSYNHFDSYPDGLGADLIEEIRAAIANGTFDQWENLLMTLKEVQEDQKPTTEDIEKLKNSTNLSVSRQSTGDWYCLLRGTQGSLKAILECGYIMNTEYDPIFHEYIYILNFDTKQFEAYASHHRRDAIGKWDFTSLPDFNKYEADDDKDSDDD